jgi:WhiB family redox-sensing transcriptional regulator
MAAADIHTLYALHPLPGDWRDEAACKGKLHLFFAPRAERPQARVRREALARRLCASCPVQASCREFARTNHEYGFWGGESEEERHLAGYTVAAPIGVRARVARAERERDRDRDRVVTHHQGLRDAETA